MTNPSLTFLIYLRVVVLGDKRWIVLLIPHMTDTYSHWMYIPSTIQWEVTSLNWVGFEVLDGLLFLLFCKTTFWRIMTELDCTVRMTINEMLCSECGQVFSKLKVYWANKIWLFCPRCGLVVNGERIDGMGIEEFTAWLHRNCPNMGYAEKRRVIELRERLGNSKALRCIQKV